MFLPVMSMYQTVTDYGQGLSWELGLAELCRSTRVLILQEIEANFIAPLPPLAAGGGC